jgi:hypothetical protein
MKSNRADEDEEEDEDEAFGLEGEGFYKEDVDLDFAVGGVPEIDGDSDGDGHIMKDNGLIFIFFILRSRTDFYFIFDSSPLRIEILIGFQSLPLLLEVTLCLDQDPRSQTQHQVPTLERRTRS